MCNRNCKHKYHHPVTHCIFDLDGTLLDTETAYEQVIEEMLRDRGIEYTVELRGKVLGTTSEDTWKILTEELRMGKNAWKRFLEEFRKRSHNRVAKCPLMPGAEKLLRHLSDRRVPLAIATSSRESTYYHKIQLYKPLFQVFHHAVCSGSDPEVKMGKPNPDIFIICADRFEDGPCPDDCLVFEDSINGVIAAKKAGMQCVAIPNKDIPRSQFKDATLILNSLEEFTPEYFGLPCYFTTE